MKRDWEKTEWCGGTLRTRVVHYKHCHGEMYRLSWMMEEKEECM